MHVDCKASAKQCQQLCPLNGKRPPCCARPNCPLNVGNTTHESQDKSVNSKALARQQKDSPQRTATGRKGRTYFTQSCCNNAAHLGGTGHAMMREKLVNNWCQGSDSVTDYKQQQQLLLQCKPSSQNHMNEFCTNATSSMWQEPEKHYPSDSTPGNIARAFMAISYYPHNLMHGSSWLLKVSTFRLLECIAAPVIDATHSKASY